MTDTHKPFRMRRIAPGHYEATTPGGRLFVIRRRTYKGMVDCGTLVTVAEGRGTFTPCLPGCRKTTIHEAKVALADFLKKESK